MYINHNADAELHKLDHYFKMKSGSIGDPDLYLGGNVCPIELVDTTDGPTTAWGLSPTKYVSATINNAEEYLAKHYNGCKFPKNHAQALFATGY